MVRHFVGLYALIVLTLGLVSWGQDKLLQSYGSRDTADERVLSIALGALEARLEALPTPEWKRTIDQASADSGGGFELFSAADVVGPDILARLARGQIAYLQGTADENWALKRIDADHILAIKLQTSAAARSLLEWAVTAAFYAAMALVIMLWIWPLTRDLRRLERAAARYGDKNWTFDAPIKPRSQIYPLAETFRDMAQRIDGLIASHKDMSNAVSHEIKTPLARMQFEIEMARGAVNPTELGNSLDNLKADVAEINDLVSATLNYAILERADLRLDLGVHDFATLLPAIVDSIHSDSRAELDLSCRVGSDAHAIVCDLHLIETAVKNLIYNATRYAASRIAIVFEVRSGINTLTVDDDGPGIPERERRRVFDSFVRLEPTAGDNKGFGLGLAIVKRTLEWHHGHVTAGVSPWGGARFSASWPTLALESKHPAN